MLTQSGYTIDLKQTEENVYEAFSMVPQVYTRQNLQQLAKDVLSVDLTDRKFYDVRKRYSDLINPLPNVWSLHQAKCFMTVVYLVDRFRNHKTVGRLYEATKAELSKVLDDDSKSIQEYLSHVRKIY